jgi:lysyl-tRNA synthetase class 2
MARQPVDSSMIVSLGYNPLTKVLEVEFRNGRVVEYHGVPSDVHRDMMEAHSKGQFLARAVKPNYPFRYKEG